MSLHVLADHMASKGRNGDSMLVHMTPGEVAGLHALAMKHGGSLTINPDTGLPEASFLKSLLPMIAGFALGPAGFGLVSSGLTAGALVGGVTSLATGSLSKGLMAGLGAYGGFGLGEGLAGVGAAEMSQGTIQSQLPEFTGNVTEYADKVNALRAQTLSAANAPGAIPYMDKVSAGLSNVSASPMDALGFAKNNMMPLAAAAAPIAADMMVPTATKMPTNTNPAYIRQYVTGDRPQAPRALSPVLASEWGSRSFSDAYAKPMAEGGIVALAAGGYKPTDTEIFDYFKKPGLTDAQIAADMQTFGVSAADIARATGTQNQQADYEKRFAQAVATPTTSAPEFLAATQDVGLQNQALENAMQNAGMSQAAQYAATHQLTDTAPITGTDFYNKIGYTAGALPGDQGGIEGLYANINYAAQGLQNQMGAGKMTGQEAREAALTEMNRIGMSAADLKAATGKTLAELFPDTKVKPPVVQPPITSVVPGATQLPGATVYDNGAFGNYGSGNVTGTDYLGREVSIATPGDIITNPDGSRTVTPNIPGRPYGGFTGIEALKSAYTAGGGSLGYTPYVPKTAAEHNAMFNKQTDDSLDAYNYLIGKAKYPTKSRATEIMKPYEEAVLGYPVDITKKKFINVDGKMVKNPKYVEPQTQAQKAAAAATAAKLGKASTIEVVDSSGESSQTYTAVLQDDGTYLAGNGKKYDVTGKELAAGGGMMGYAVGGGLGSLGSYSDGGRLLKGPGDGVSDSIPATIGRKQQPARLADGEFVVPARIVSELGNGSTDAGARKLYAMMDRVQKARGKTTGKKRVAANTRADKYLPA